LTVAKPLLTASLLLPQIFLPASQTPSMLPKQLNGTGLDREATLIGRFRIQRFLYCAPILLLLGCERQEIPAQFAIGGTLTGTLGGVSISAPITKSLSASLQDGAAMSFASGRADADDIAAFIASKDQLNFSTIGYHFDRDRECQGGGWYTSACARYSGEGEPYRLLHFFIGARALGMGTRPTVDIRQMELAKANGGSYAERGKTYYTDTIRGHDAITRCSTNSAPDTFDWTFLCSTNVVVGERASSRFTHYLYANFNPETDLSAMYAEIGSIAEALVD
jgi:hypothetical protein